MQQVKRPSESDTQNFAEVTVSVESCKPESDAIDFADILLDYDQGTGNYDCLAKYSGTKIQTPGSYQVATHSNF